MKCDVCAICAHTHTRVRARVCVYYSTLLGPIYVRLRETVFIILVDPFSLSFMGAVMYTQRPEVS